MLSLTSHFVCVARILTLLGMAKLLYRGRGLGEMLSPLSLSEELINTGCRKCSVCGKQEESMERDAGVKQSPL